MPDIVGLQHEGRPAAARVEGRPGAPAVLFFHPFPLTAACWDALLARCAQAGLLAVAVDAPGFGASAPAGKPVTMEELARLGTAALDAVGAQRAAVVGCSMGGYATMAFGRLFPERLAGAVLLCTKASADTAAARDNRETQARAALSRGPQAVTATLLPRLLAPEAPQEVRSLVERLAAGASAQGIADALRGMAVRPDSGPQLSQWRVPALVIEGAKDQLMPPAELAALAAAIPGAARLVVQGAGHLAFMEKAAEVGEAVVELAGRSIY